MPLPTHERPNGSAFDGAQQHPEYDPAYSAGYETASTGFIMVGAREYAPEIGRFLQPDPRPTGPELQWGQLNRWAYCANDPVNFSDPSGRSIGVFLVALASFIVAGFGLYAAAVNSAALNWAVAIAAFFASAVGIYLAWQGLSVGWKTFLTRAGAIVGALLWLALLMGMAAGGVVWYCVILPFGWLASAYAFGLNLVMFELETNMDVSPLVRLDGRIIGFPSWKVPGSLRGTSQYSLGYVASRGTRPPVVEISRVPEADTELRPAVG